MNQVQDQLKNILATDGGLAIYQHYGIEADRLKKAIRSPLRKDENPSFSIFQGEGGKWLWHDFATDESGDAVSFLMAMDSLDFKEALERVFEIYGDAPQPMRFGKRDKPLGKAAEKPQTVPFPEQEFQSYMAHKQNHLIAYLEQELGIPYSYIKSWCLRHGRIGRVVFGYTDGQGKPLNIKRVPYLKNGKRDRSKTIFYAKPKSGNAKYAQALFGLSRLSGKPVAIVESEKTAIIAGHFYPHFDWLALGGSSATGTEKLKVLKGKEGIILMDADKAGRQGTLAKKLELLDIEGFTALDLFPDREDGYDLADALADGLRPELKWPLGDEPIPEEEEEANDAYSLALKYFEKRYHIRFNTMALDYEMRKLDERKYGELNESDLCSSNWPRQASNWARAG